MPGLDSVLVSLVTVVFCATLYSTFQRYTSRTKGNVSLPPGPPGLPLIGNLRDMPKEREWLTYVEWGKRYGDVVYVQIFGQPIIILNSSRAVLDLFERRSQNYSDRPYSLMISELMGWKWNFGQLGYGHEWRRHRRSFHQFFNANACQQHYPVQLSKTHNLLQRLGEDPEDWAEHVRWFAGAVILKIVYGYDTDPKNDPFVKLADEADEGLIEAVNAGAFLVDTLPFLRYVPDWIPGAGFKAKARQWNDASVRLREALFSKMSSPATVHTESSFLTEGLAKISSGQTESDHEMDILKNCAGTAYAAGAGTVIAAMEVFFLAMTLYPEAQKKAQVELDEFVGQDRLPEFRDQKHLNFVQAIVQEVLRWQPTTPLAMPHKTVHDDIYDGHFIPAGSIVVGNLWGILQNEETYPDPSVFKPERFISESGKALPLAAESFGFGRRVCPGKYFALNSLWITVASVLSCYDISKAVDANGDVIEPEVVFSPGALSRIKPFRCRITPRRKFSI